MAVGQATFSDLGSGVGSIFSGFGDLEKAKGAKFEASSYRTAAAFADQEAGFAAVSTAIKESQADRELYNALGGVKEEVAAAGFQEGGSALDILRQSAQEGATTRAVLGEQGLIQVAGYHAEAESYQQMAKAADTAAKADKIAGVGSFISAAISGAAAIATLA